MFCIFGNVTHIPEALHAKAFSSLVLGINQFLDNRYEICLPGLLLEKGKGLTVSGCLWEHFAWAGACGHGVGKGYEVNAETFLFDQYARPIAASVFNASRPMKYLNRPCM